MVESFDSDGGGGFRHGWLFLSFGRAAAVVGLLVVVAEGETALGFQVERGREFGAQRRRDRFEVLARVGRHPAICFRQVELRVAKQPAHHQRRSDAGTGIVAFHHAGIDAAEREVLQPVEDGETTIRPLAGTRRRGKTPQEDRELAEELLADPKERAEHVMLIDLARNDVGRVSEFGSLQLSDVMVVERYSHVMHITSNVSGKLRPGLSAVEALRAGLPAGTVSGAPKVRAMEIIDEVEPQKRGPYGGAVGYIDFTGNMDTCIALRTLVMKDGIIYVQAGAGIVADSVPELEYQETLSKARAMVKAIHIAETQLTTS